MFRNQGSIDTLMTKVNQRMELEKTLRELSKEGWLTEFVMQEASALWQRVYERQLHCGDAKVLADTAMADYLSAIISIGKEQPTEE